jgi:CheY-like chemotaxis protein
LSAAWHSSHFSKPKEVKIPTTPLPFEHLPAIIFKIMSSSLLPICDPIIKAKASVSKQLAQPLVMVVDDHADTRDMLRFAIEACGCRVVEAADGEQAVRLAEHMLPNLILMDTSLPSVDGYMATERIRRLDRERQIRVIFLSGYGQPEAREKAFAVGGDDYLVKPINLAALELLLEEYLIRDRSNQAQIAAKAS